MSACVWKRSDRICRDMANEGHPSAGKSVEALAAEVKASFSKSLDEARSIAEKALSEVQANGKLSGSVQEKADEALIKMNALQEQLAGMEQKMVRLSGPGGNTCDTSLGQTFVADSKIREFLDSQSKRGKVDMVFKSTITSATTDAAGSAGRLVTDTRLPDIIAAPERRMTIRDLITPGQMDGNTLEYVRETGFTNQAGTVAETEAVPQSSIKFDLVNTTAKVIGHYMKASRQILDDAAQLASYIDGRLRYGLAYKEEAQLLNGDGTGQNLLGIIPQAKAYSAPITMEKATSIDVMRLAMLQAALAEYPATAHVLNPVDWAWIETLKDSQGRYLIGNPQGSATPTLWGLPVVTTQAIGVDKFLTGAFRLGAQVFDRWHVRVEVATEHGDDFIHNRVTILCEERLALAVYRPEAFIYGDFGRID
ncbi:phage major capsid protein [Haematospirillum jordaniae]|uniref:phage major capsid protein n=1 Tax=Haematospirillum jordaniae TaxID=1549855 RepID=UPI001ADE752D|nr:phage major capsid protein [Haematospirillum jordaniae]